MEAINSGKNVVSLYSILLLISLQVSLSYGLLELSRTRTAETADMKRIF